MLLTQDSIARLNVDDQVSTVAQLEGALELARAAIDNAKLNLTYTRISAPIAGKVGLRLVDAGNIVSAASTTGLVVITEVQPIAVLFTIPEDNLQLVLSRMRDSRRAAGGRGPGERRHAAGQRKGAHSGQPD